MMKKMNIWSMMMLILMVIPLVVACGGDGDGDGDHDTLPFTKELLVEEYQFWEIEDVTGNNTRMRKGATAEFYADGTCKGFDNMETSYEIKEGKLYTYYAKTKEPMFVYNLLMKGFTRYHTELTVRVDGTLDNKTSSIIRMRKNTIVQSAIVGEWVCSESDTKLLSIGEEINIGRDGTYTSTLSMFGTSGTYTISGNNIVFKSKEGRTISIDNYNFIENTYMLLGGTTDSGESFICNFYRK